MDNYEQTPKKNIEGFFKFVFSLDEKSKNMYMNLFQYIILAIIPILILNKLIISKLISETDEGKSSLEISFEVVSQLVLIFGGYILIDRIVNYIPTYSGDSYEQINYFSIVIPFLIIVLSIQSKLGEKVTILWERLLEYFGQKETVQHISKDENVKVKQPIMQNQSPLPPPQITNIKNEQEQTQTNYTNQIEQRGYNNDTTSINNLPLPTKPVQQLPDYNEMYATNNSNNIVASNDMGGWGAPF